MFFDLGVIASAILASVQNNETKRENTAILRTVCMKTKTKCFALVFGMAAISVMALIVEEYQGWSVLQNKSPAIIIARCKSTPEWMHYTNGTVSFNPTFGIVQSEMEIVSVLKGTNIAAGTTVTFGSEYWPRQAENYLIMAQSFNGVLCRANEDYRVVPLGIIFTMDPLKGKTVDEQIRFMLQSRLNHLKEEIQKDKAEEQRLEEALKN